MIGFVIGVISVGVAYGAAKKIKGNLTVTKTVRVRRDVDVGGNVNARGQVTGGSLTTGGALKAGSVSAAGNVNAAGNVTGGEFTYSGPVGNVLVIPPPAFAVDTSDTGVDIDGSRISVVGTNTTEAPVVLPQGATVTSLTAFFATSGSGVSLSLIHHTNDCCNASPLATLVFPNAPFRTSQTTTSISSPTIGDGYYTLDLSANGSNIDLSVAKIGYTVGKPGPASG